MRRIAPFVMSSKVSRCHGIDDEIPMTKLESFKGVNHLSAFEVRHSFVLGYFRSSAFLKRSLHAARVCRETFTVRSRARNWNCIAAELRASFETIEV
jgi:hypothetical protein